VAENVVAPLVVFYAVLALFGMRGAIIAALVWCYVAVGARLVLRRPVPGILVLGALTLTARTAVGLGSGSVFLYFLQPSLGNFAVGALFLASVPAGRPLAARLAGDFCALPPDLLTHSRVRSFFSRVTLLWALVFAVNGATTLWALLTVPAAQFPIISTAASSVATVLAIGGSLLWFRSSLREAGVRLRLGPAVQTPA
jgi:hypothetical protein